MKKALLLLLCGALAFCACRKDPVPEPPSKDADLTGQKVDVSGFPESTRKLFVLNEGGMGSNNASLDFLRLSDGNYITGAFKKMNPNVGAGLGDVGNDVAVHEDELWIVVNNSGIVEVVSAKDETEIAAIAVPTPRNIAFDDQYAYVTSWAGAYASGSYDENGYYVITDSKNPKGQVYRIDLKTKTVAGSVEVGYQPEGIACHAGRLYVANSGGISSQLPPDYAYDNTLSIIDTKSFKVTETLPVQVNLKNVYADGQGNIYVRLLEHPFGTVQDFGVDGGWHPGLQGGRLCERVHPVRGYGLLHRHRFGIRLVGRPCLQGLVRPGWKQEGLEPECFRDNPVQPVCAGCRYLLRRGCGRLFQPRHRLLLLQGRQALERGCRRVPRTLCRVVSCVSALS